MRCLILSCKLGLSAAILCILTTTAVPSAADLQSPPNCVVTGSGDLLAEISSIADRLPGQDSNGMVVPTRAQMAAWEQLIEAAKTEDLMAACSVITANGFPYHIVRYTDQGHGNRTYLLLKENSPISVGWGTYLISLEELPRDVVIEVPHPGCEWHTETEGLELFRQARAFAFLMAGTDRCANTTYSPCDGTTTFCGQEEPFRTSDVAHATNTMFQATHRALIQPGTNTVAIQIHGCSDPSCPDLFISNGTCTPGQVAQEFYRNALAACQGFSIDLADCTPPECSLVGTTNLQGRYSNGVFFSPDFDACTESAPGPSNPEQFLHLEQSAELRGDFACLATTLRTTFSTPLRFYLPISLDRHTLTDGQLDNSPLIVDSRPDESEQWVCSTSPQKTIPAKATNNLIETGSDFAWGWR